ncbi:hypothetical protein WA158_003805 [Blastocystis sp. Blastoise]
MKTTLNQAIQEVFTSSNKDDNQSIHLSNEEKAELEIQRCRDRFTKLRNRATKAMKYNKDQVLKHIKEKDINSASYFLKLSKMEEDKIKNYSKQIIQLMQTLDTLVEAEDQKLFYESIKVTHSVLKSYEKDMGDIQKIHDSLEDIENMKENTKEFNALFDSVFEKEDMSPGVEEEYEEIQKQMELDEQKNNISIPHKEKASDKEKNLCCEDIQNNSIKKQKKDESSFIHLDQSEEIQSNSQSINTQNSENKEISSNTISISDNNKHEKLDINEETKELSVISSPSQTSIKEEESSVSSPIEILPQTVVPE